MRPTAEHIRIVNAILDYPAEGPHAFLYFFN